MNGKWSRGGAGLDLVRLVLFVDVQALARRAVDVRDVHVVRDELAAVARRRDRRRVLVEDVDLLERETLGLCNDDPSAIVS